MNKFKVGDKVFIVSKFGKVPGLSFNPEMEHWIGKTATVSHVAETHHAAGTHQSHDYSKYQYRCRRDKEEFEWTWLESSLEPLIESIEIPGLGTVLFKLKGASPHE